MTRYHQFNAQYPDEAKKINEGNQEMGEIIWKAFARATWLHKFFPFSFSLPEIPPKTDNDSDRGIQTKPFVDPDYPIIGGRDY
jgi:hypothetical protein